MLTHMEFQYLVALCCFRNSPEAVDIIVGDMVWDEEAEKPRDVDITVTIDGKEIVAACLGYEAKHEERPLDVTKVEQLCAKLLDMPSLTSRAIVSASGYTKSAKLKAKKKGVRLYEFKKWDPPAKIDPHGPGMRPVGSVFIILGWTEFSIKFNRDVQDRTIYRNVILLDKAYQEDGTQHPEFSSLQDFTSKIADHAVTQYRKTHWPELKPTKVHPLERPDGPLGDPFFEKLIVEIEPKVFMGTKDGLLRLYDVEIFGHLQWSEKKNATVQMVMVDCDTKDMFAGAAVMRVTDEIMMACTFSPNDTMMHVHPISLSDKHKNQITKLKLVNRRAKTS